MGTITDAHAAETQLARLLDEVEAGGEVVITRGGRAVAKLVRAEDPAPAEEEPRPKRKLGLLAGRFPPGLIEEQVKWDKHTDPEWQRMIRIMEGEEEDGPAGSA